jgi:hypothetical protein
MLSMCFLRSFAAMVLFNLLSPAKLYLRQIQAWHKDVDMDLSVGQGGRA